MRPNPQAVSDIDARILSVVRQGGEVSKAEVARRVGLSRSALGARLHSLRERGLIEDVGRGSSSGGRPPTLVRFGTAAGGIVAVDLGATSVDVAVTSLNADVLVHLSEAADVSEGPEPVLAQVTRLIDEAIAQSPLDAAAILGCGMGIPCPVDFRNGLPVSPPLMPSWHLFPVRDHLEKRLGVPVLVDNDVNMMALGERWAGVSRDAENFFFVKVGTGIGCGIICHHEIYRGAQGCAGDIGHIAVTPEPVVCRCGNRGCLEAVAGGAALARDATAAAKSGESLFLAQRLEEKGSLSAEDLGAAASFGDPVAVDLIREAGVRIGQAFASLINFYNPSLIVLGGGVTKLGDIFLSSIREAAYRRALPLATRHIVIEPSTLGDRVGVLGAAEMVLGELFRLTPVRTTEPASVAWSRAG